ncbi:hypothetical protein J3E74DRAFT_297044 [Bipolaris maydis]|nr:hypothetical protein J3E74DRAFT_297044 [Bipolaris maydis]
MYQKLTTKKAIAIATASVAATTALAVTTSDIYSPPPSGVRAYNNNYNLFKALARQLRPVKRRRRTKEGGQMTPALLDSEACMISVYLGDEITRRTNTLVITGVAL